MNVALKTKKNTRGMIVNLTLCLVNFSCELIQGMSFKWIGGKTRSLVPQGFSLGLMLGSKFNQLIYIFHPCRRYCKLDVLLFSVACLTTGIGVLLN